MGHSRKRIGADGKPRYLTIVMDGNGRRASTGTFGSEEGRRPSSTGTAILRVTSPTCLPCSVDLTLVALPVHLAQLELLQFAGGGAGQPRC